MRGQHAPRQLRVPAYRAPTAPRSSAGTARKCRQREKLPWLICKKNTSFEGPVLVSPGFGDTGAGPLDPHVCRTLLPYAIIIPCLFPAGGAGRLATTSFRKS